MVNKIMRGVSSMTKVLRLVIGIVFLVASQVGAATLSVESGLGTLDSYSFLSAGDVVGNAWTINDTLTGNSPFLLRFATENGSPLSPGTLTGTFHQAGKWFLKSVTNNTGVAWTSFELEVQSIMGVASTDGDGLSFAQGSGLAFTSDRFAIYTRIDDTRDYLNFHGGTVNPGDTVSFAFAISDNSSNNPFWLQETPNRAEVPIPATFLIFGSGLLGLAGFRKKINK
jgi:hypothetical protein